MADSTIKIALADDHQLFINGLRLLISNFENIEVLFTVNNGQELIDELEKQMPDVIIMDLNMPKKDGIEAIKLIRASNADVKIILLSMHNNERVINHVMKLGANGYLRKDENPANLQEAILAVMSKGFYFNDYTSKALLHNLSALSNINSSPLDLNNRLGLTFREVEVLKLICKELTTPEIGKKLYISKRTVEGHRKNLLAKTGARNTVGLVLFALKNKLVDPVNLGP